MTTRIRWYRAETGIDLRAVKKALLGNEYSADRSWGFRIDKVETGSLLFRFIERIEHNEQSEDPFGKLLSFHRLEYRQTSLRLSDRPPEIEVHNAPRSMRLLLNELSAAIGPQVEIDPIKLAVEAWLRSLEHTVGKVKVVLREVTNLEISPRASARLLVFGQEDIRRHGDLVSRTGSSRVERIGVEWQARGDLFACEIHENGRAKHQVGSEEAVVVQLRKSLSHALL